MIWTPDVPELAHLRARDDVATLAKEGGLGVELGVAEGIFSERVLTKSKLGFLWSIDMYSDERSHDTEQYKRALRRLMRFKGRSSLLRMRFDEALALFKDNSLDFIYVDGYAHTGEEGGQTFRDWWPKLKPGGIFAGDDYNPEAWPQVVEAVETFCREHGLEPNVIPFIEPNVPWCEHPTWFVRKPDAQ